MRVYIEPDRFHYIEDMEGVTARQFSEKFGISTKIARTWLSRWKARGYLVHIAPKAYRREPGSKHAIPVDGVYKTNPAKWWGRLAYDSETWNLVGGDVDQVERPDISGSL